MKQKTLLSPSNCTAEERKRRCGEVYAVRFFRECVFSHPPLLTLSNNVSHFHSRHQAGFLQVPVFKGRKPHFSS
ncbi:Hypothetical predicted protein [Scomber scombrus]|uniref:Uncharacterized protein n=1 Tax=Scomber scombrus TaxID=13677 RepID=A0AAV1MV31_SCOSC